MNSVHPGVIATNLAVDFRTSFEVDEYGDKWFKNDKQGAATSVWACVAPEVEGKGGLYMENCAITGKDNFQPTVMNINSGVPFVKRLSGTAAHVWVEKDYDTVAEAGVAILHQKGLL